MVAEGVLIWEIFSRKSSLKDRARLAILVPRRLPLFPEEDEGCGGVCWAATPPPDDGDDDDIDVLTTAPETNTQSGE